MKVREAKHYAEANGYKWIGKNEREMYVVRNVKTNVLLQATTLQVLKQMIDESNKVK